MNMIMKVMVALIAAEHLIILWVEMFAWTTKGKEMFKSIPSELFEKTKVMAANQGLYNGFLAAGLCWSVLIQDTVWSFQIAIFFLACVVVAGCYGALTSAKSIFFKQAMPALVVLVAVLLLH